MESRVLLSMVQNTQCAHHPPKAAPAELKTIAEVAPVTHGKSVHIVIHFSPLTSKSKERRKGRTILFGGRHAKSEGERRVKGRKRRNLGFVFSGSHQSNPVLISRYLLRYYCFATATTTTTMTTTTTCDRNRRPFGNLGYWGRKQYASTHPFPLVSKVFVLQLTLLCSSLFLPLPTTLTLPTST